MTTTKPPRRVDGTGTTGEPRVAIAHDYLTVRGGAERVVLSLADAFPDAPIHTSLFEPSRTFPGFDPRRVRPMPLNRLRVLREDHRRALPLLAVAFSRRVIDADVVICSSSAWAHGVRTTGRKIVFCYTPARWLYQTQRYLRGQPRAVQAVATALRPAVRRWDRRQALSADRYLVISRAVQQRVRDVYGIEAEVVHPPHTVDVDAPAEPVQGLVPGFWLTVARLMGYKNVDAILQAFALMPERQLVVVGTGPEEARLRAQAPANARLLGTVNDSQLRWLYANCAGVMAASHEDYGLTPLEAAAFGKPSVALRWGGYLDTIIDGETGTLVQGPDAGLLADAAKHTEETIVDPKKLTAHAARFDERSFHKRMRALATDAPDLTVELCDPVTASR